MIAAPLIIHFTIAGIGFTLAIRARRSALLTIYLAFVALAALVGLRFLTVHSPELYRVAFFIVEIVHNSLLCGLALEVAIELVPQKFAAPWCVFWLVLLIGGLIHHPPGLSTMGLLNVTVSADFAACGLLLVTALPSDVHWTQFQVLVALGVVFVVLAGAVPEIRLLNEQAAFKAAMQWADIFGFTLLASASVVIERKKYDSV